MPPRMMGAGQGRPFLSWGELSSEPRSVVFDADRAMVFPGSPVITVLPGAAHAGTVVELLARDRVSVRWSDGRTTEGRPAQLRVTGPFVLPESRAAS